MHYFFWLGLFMFLFFGVFIQAILIYIWYRYGLTISDPSNINVPNFIQTNTKFAPAWLILLIIINSMLALIGIILLIIGIVKSVVGFTFDLVKATTKGARSPDKSPYKKK